MRSEGMTKDSRGANPLRGVDDLAGLLRQLPGAFMLVDRQGRIVHANQLAESMFRFASGELDGVSIEDLVPPDVRERHEKYRGGFFAAPSLRPMGHGRDLRGRRKDGSVFPIEVALNQLETNEGSVVVASLVDSTKRHEALTRCMRSERNLREILDSLFGFVGVYSLDGVLIEANRAPLEAAGLTREQVLGKPFWETYWWSYSESVQARLRDAMGKAALGEVVRYETPVRVLDGKLIVIDVMFGPLRNERGEITNILGFAVDITEQKRAQESLEASLREKEVLLREIHHRVKNNLQVVSSLLQLQARRVSDSVLEGVLAESVHRVRSMALIHEQLYQTADLSQIDFANYVRSLAESLRVSFASDERKILIHSELEPVTLTVGAAVPCGLAINELVTNALEHAFPNGKGTVTIRLSEIRGTVVVEVKDDGVGLRANGVRKESLGLSIVDALVKQLRADLCVASERGTSFRLSFPRTAPPGD